MYRNLLKEFPEEILEKMSEQELWDNFYCPKCKVKQTLTADEVPFRYCPKCGAVG